LNVMFGRERRRVSGQVDVVLPNMQLRLFRVILDVVTLELDKLVEAKFGECLSFSRVFPPNPGKILFQVRHNVKIGASNLRGQGSRID
jgi:hypothetical protein